MQLLEWDGQVRTAPVNDQCVPANYATEWSRIPEHMPDPAEKGELLTPWYAIMPVPKALYPAEATEPNNPEPSAIPCLLQSMSGFRDGVTSILLCVFLAGSTLLIFLHYLRLEYMSCCLLCLQSVIQYHLFTRLCNPMSRGAQCCCRCVYGCP